MPVHPWRLLTYCRRLNYAEFKRSGSGQIAALLLVLCIAPASCQSHKAASRPSIEPTHLPPATEGGRERVDTISGRGKTRGPKQQIVVGAHAGSWWVQPSSDHAFKTEPFPIWSEVSQGCSGSRPPLRTRTRKLDSRAPIPEWFGRSTHELPDWRRVRNRRREKRK